MEINVLRLRTILDDREDEVVKANTNFLEEINNELMEDDLLIKENAKDAPCTIVFVETGGSEPLFIKHFDELKVGPILILSSCRDNSLPASLEIKTYCSINKVPAFVLTGDEKHCANVIKHFAHAYHAKAILAKSNLGVIGKPSDWLIASKVDPNLVYTKFGINLVDISMEELMEEIDKHDMGKVPHLDTLKKKFKDSDTLDMACYIYGAIKRLVKKYKLDGLTIRCFDLLGQYKNTSCLALALLNEEGITAACEGDVLSLITMHMFRALTGRPSFQANPSKVDNNNKEILLAHCTLPLNMVSKYELLTHFESNLGIGIKGEMPLGEVAICKLFMTPKGNLSSSLVIAGEIKENFSLPGYCRTQIVVTMSDFDYFNFFKEDFGNHVVVAYGDVTDDFMTLLTFYETDKFFTDKD